MKAAHKIALISSILAGLYGSSLFAAAPGLVFSVQPSAKPIQTNSNQVLTYTIRNTSNQSIILNNIDVGPHNNPKYWAASNDCNNVVTAAHACHITLTLYAPSEPGFMNTALVVSYGQPANVLLSRPIQFDVIPVSQSVSSVTSTTKTTTAVAASAATTFVPLKKPPTSGFQVSVAAGAANLHSSVGNEVFPAVFPGVPAQTNTLHGSSHNTEFTGGAGVAYDFVMPAAAKGQNHYVLRDIALGVNAYYVGGNDPSGEVYRYGLPQFNFDNYNVDLNSWRVMLDSEWDFHPIGQHVVPFVMAGVGDAINTMSYSESPISSSNDPGGQVSLSHHTKNNFAYEAGLGVKVLINDNSQISLRYLYANLGSAEADSSELQKPLTVSNLNTSSVLLGYTYKFGK